jgi:transposase
VLDELLFSPELHLSIEQIDYAEKVIRIAICSENETGVCPGCGMSSDRVHSEYERYPQDLPFMGHTVQLRARVRRFFCVNESCGRRTFAEQFPCLLMPKARRTQRLVAQHTEIAFALGGEAGRRLCVVLGMCISGDTLIRSIRNSPEPQLGTPRVLGIDDWAKRKGQEYGTILVDLEARQPVDVLDSRTVEAVAHWLKEHPGVEIISRDRGTEYTKAASEGAPHAEQVADRWHLLSNLREALVALLEKKPAALAAAAQVAQAQDMSAAPQQTSPETTLSSKNAEESSKQTSPSLEKNAPPEPATTAQERKVTRAERRQQRFEQVHTVYQATGSVRAVARQLNMSRRAVKRYLNSESCPQYPLGRIRISKLTPYLKSLQERWQAGCTNASELWRQIRQEGFDGSRGLVARWAARERQRLPAPIRYRRQQSAAFQALPLPPPPVAPWSAKRASWLIVKKPPDLAPDEKAALARMIEVDPEVALGVDLARQFMTIVRHRKEDRLDPWMESVKASGIRTLVSFVNGLQKDLAAVRNALRYVWSNGQTEGQVNRLKFLKRQTYGRAKFDLLRKRVLPRSAPS